MIDILMIGLLAAVCAVGVYVCRWEGMILEEVDKVARKRLPKWLYKPLIGCVYCNAGWWGIALALVFGAPVFGVALSAVAAIGFTGVLVGIARV